MSIIIFTEVRPDPCAEAAESSQTNTLSAACHAHIMRQGRASSAEVKKDRAIPTLPHKSSWYGA
jgi:hypothetical protein